MSFVARLIDRALSYTIGRYIVIGFISLLIDTAIFTLCNKVFGIWYLYATIISATAAWTFNFPKHRGWTFEDRRSPAATGVQGSLHFVLKICNTYFWGPYLLYLLVDGYQWDPVVGKFAIGFGLGGQNFVLCYFLIFRKPAA